MKHAVVRAITSVAIALILLAEAHAIESARTITLVPGWSAVWLDVDPVETAGDDAGLPKLVEDVFADPAVTIVARPDVPVGSAEFVSDPREKSFNQDGRWLMWRRNSELGANTLTRIRGNRAYLVYSDSKRTITISVTGEATFHTPISRTGPLADPLEFDVVFSGDAVPGDDYLALSSTASIPMGSAGSSLSIAPKPNTALPTEAMVVTVAVAEDPTRFTLGHPAEVSVILTDELVSYAAWKAANFSGEPQPGDGDNDSRTTMMEYLLQSNPHFSDSPAFVAFDRLPGGKVELRLLADASLSDVSIGVEASNELVSWQTVTGQFAHMVTAAGGNRVLHSFRSYDLAVDRRFFGIGLEVFSP